MATKSERNPKDYTVHMIGNAHIDPAWLWRWPEGLEETFATTQSALDRMAETPEFVYCQAAAITYRWVHEHHEPMWQELASRVKEGRWAVVGGWIVQPDCNIPCGESFVRHGLYGKRYLSQRLGVEVKTGYNVDTFGHCNALPQILKKCGFDHYVFFRPGKGEKTLPNSPFWWESPDGTRLLTYRPPLHYGFGGPDISARILRAYQGTAPMLRDVMCFYGVGNHGGGPTQQNIAAIKALAGDPDMPNVVFSTPEAFFARALAQTQDYPVVADDLQHHAVGCYSAVSEVKRQNRKSENLLLTAEKFAAIAHFGFGRRYPQGELSFAWENVLFNQFHDILAGSSIKPVYDDANEMYSQSQQVGNALLEGALGTIAAQVDTRGEGQPVLVFNPCSWDRVDAAVARITLPERPQRVFAYDAQGQELPAQVVSTEPAAGGFRVGVAFIASVPALGYALYHLRAAGGGRQPDTGLSAGHYRLENEYLRVEIDPADGTLREVYDKAHGVSVLAGSGNRLVVLDDPSDTWSHDVKAYRDEIGQFEAVTVDLVERGPVRATVRVTSVFGDSSIVQDISLYAGLARVDFGLEIDWHERLRMLKVAFPVNVKQPVATFETPYANIVRPPTGDEEPGQSWIDVTGTGPKRGKYGASLLNESKYGFDIKDHEMRMSILRSPIYGFHDPRQIIPGEEYDWTDQGVQQVGYRLLPHQGGWQDGRTVNRAQELNHPLLCRAVAAHEGNLPARASFLRVEPETVILTVAKQAEDDEGLVLRMYEAYGQDTQATVTLQSPKLTRKLPVGHYEIKTVKVGTGARRSLAEVDMLERPLPK